MKILICGDSWTEGWGVKNTQAWPNYLDCDFLNTAKSGASNEQIVKQFIKNYNQSFDAVIIGWSGVTRYDVNGKKFEFSVINNNAVNFFKNISLSDIINRWEIQIAQIINYSKVPVIQFSVFGDKPFKSFDNFLNLSFLEFLANSNNTHFKHNIPIFEFDWLCENNYKFTKKFAKKYFDRNWQLACLEREDLRNTKYFLDCGHPTEEGHKLWGRHIKNVLTDVLK